MYRILALMLLVSTILIGCAAEPTATPSPVPEQPTAVVPTEANTNTPEPTATDVPTVAPTDTPQPTSTPTPVTGVVKSTLNVRDHPTTRGKLLGVLKKDDVVTLVGRTEDSAWLEINYPLGEQTDAWVIAERIDTTATVAALPSIAAVSPTTAATTVAVQPTASIPPTVTTTAATPAATASAATPAAGATVAATKEATSTGQATAVPPAATAVPPSTGGTPPGSILFDSFENGNFNIYRVRADGTALTQLIAGGSDPALSPDGSHIAYRMRKNTGGLGIGIASSTGVYESTVTEESAAGYPTWSADGNNIAYHILPSQKLSGRIQRIGVGPDNTPINVGVGVRPAWQPGGSQNVLFDGCKGGSDCGSLLILNAFDGDPNNPNLITTGTSGAWSPNASQIAFQDQDSKGNIQIWIANADGSNRKQVTTDDGIHAMPIWSSDGAWLFYRANQSGIGWAIFAIRTNGTDGRKIIDSPVHPDEYIDAKMAIAP